MARKSFETFVESIASATDDFSFAISKDPEIARIYRGTEPYNDRVNNAVSYWRYRRSSTTGAMPTDRGPIAPVDPASTSP